MGEFQIYYVIFIGIVAWFSYKQGYSDGEYDGVKGLSKVLVENGILTIEVEEITDEEDK